MTVHSPSNGSPASLDGDLLAVVLYLALASGALLALDGLGEWARLAVGAPLVAFVPGYAIVSATFPRRPPPGPGPEQLALDSWSLERVTSWRSPAAPAGIDALERIALSVLLSVVAVSTLALAASFTPWGIARGTVLAGIAIATVGGVAVAAVRRGRVPPPERFAVPARVPTDGLRSAAPTSVAAWVVVAVVLASLVAAVGALGYGGTAGGDDVSFYLVTEGEAGDELVAGNYPEELEGSESAPLVTAVENDGREPVEYAVVVTVERLGDGTEPGGEVVLDRYSEVVDPGERWTSRHRLPDGRLASDVRLRYYLYEGTPPADPTDGEPRRTLQLTVEGAGDE